MGLHGGDDVFPLTRPVFKTIEATHRKFYQTSVSAESRIEYKLCDYLPDLDKYYSVMVMSRSCIDKNTVLHEVSGHHFPLDQDLIVPGVNDFSLIYSGRSKKSMHVLLGPISFVNHSCLPNCKFKPNDGGRICLVTLKNIIPGDEITVSYSTEYFGDENHQCLCDLCSEAFSVVEYLCNKVVTDCFDYIESAVYDVSRDTEELLQAADVSLSVLQGKVYDHSAHHRDDDDDDSSSHYEKEDVAGTSRVVFPADHDEEN
ncbi:histone-lysine N-methyltransferase set9-like, partial [Myzus persicae]|uniref:histone-lysine N-methyltransferase set9-like n=1 Tax=Myzus persicae TaxID=13164 RepID=UPI000B933F03